MIKNKIILITGSKGHIGKKIVQNLKKENFIISLDIIGENKKTKKYIHLKCDLNNKTSRKNTINIIKKKFKKIDVIIHAAGFLSNHIEKSDIEFQRNNLWNQILETNLSSIFDIICELKKCLLKSKNPSILNIGSIHSSIYPDWSLYKGTKTSNLVSYSVSKGALLNLTKWLATYLAPKIRVNMVSPGGIKRKQDIKFIKNYINRTPLKRMCKVEDVVNAVVFLIDDKSGYINGHNLIIDGGYSLV